MKDPTAHARAMPIKCFARDSLSRKVNSILPEDMAYSLPAMLLVIFFGAAVVNQAACCK